MVSNMNLARRLSLLGLSSLLALGAGCDGGSEQTQTPPTNHPAIVAPPTELPAVPQSSTAPSTISTQPVSSFLWLREVPDPRKSQSDLAATPAEESPVGIARQFPRARLRLSGKGEDRLVALLYSDDPKEALEKNWQGDRYYFRMPLQTSDPAALEESPFRMAVPYEGQDETSNGVFLAGDRFHMEPIDLSVRFEPQGKQINVYIGGLFKQYDTTDVQAEPRWYHVQGIIQATVDEKK